MKIDKIVLYNFNSYEGLNEFDFSTTGNEKKIVLIGGKNGAGKTSLFSAIKIALYGPLAFGYIGINPHYIAKIKDYINSNAFHKKQVEARVEITISLLIEREIKQYQITREWNYSKQKLEENYFVKQGDKLLENQEVSYFQNYLQSLVPPDLFEFFLFDGEEVGNIFSTSSYNKYVKNAIYILCGLDTFELIRKYSTGYAGKAQSKNEEQIHEKYEELRTTINLLIDQKRVIEEESSLYQTKLEEIETALIETETEFKNAGGITNSERKKLNKEYEEAEKRKTEISTHIKMFVEGLMPFFIVRDFSDRIKRQLEIEEKSEIYSYIEKSIDSKEFLDEFDGNLSVESIEKFVQVFLNKFKPKDVEDIAPIYDLSKEDVRRVNSTMTAANDFNIHRIVQLINEKKYASERTMEINRLLRNSMDEEESRRFTEKENELLRKKTEIKEAYYRDQMKLEELVGKLNELEVESERLFQHLKNSVQNRHVFELSIGLSNMMNELLNSKMYKIQRDLENLIVEKLCNIYRKNNLITHIEINDNFDFNLYQDAVYTISEIEQLIKNIGKQAFSLEVGQKGINKLFDILEIVSIAELPKSLLDKQNLGEIKLYKKIDLSRLSKGERQIFILSLYWAIITVSGQEIPFIIDTPYARIDTNHRKEISEKFFPNISKQVVILSTDEEINEEYYEILKPYISKEYLLINDEGQNRTTIQERYFYEV